jgi:glycosyltransferase involved in cell wall biosynthesis
MKLVITIPAYNEEKTVAQVIKHIPSHIEGIEDIEIFVIDDGSSDATRERALAVGASAVSFSENKGLSRAFQRGVEEALARGADIMVNIDADGQFDGNDIVHLVKPIIEGKADFVTTSRFVNKDLAPCMPALKRWGNKQVALLISFITGKKYYDVSCGFRAYSKEVLLHLNLFGKFTYTHETFLNLAFKGLRIQEVPIKVRGEREFGESKIAHSLWKYGYNIFNTIFRTMLDYKPLKFFGWGGIILFLIGVVLDLFVGIRLLAIGAVTPYKTVGFIGLALNIFGLLLIIVGLLADMINKTRMTQERTLYYQKKQFYFKKD